MGRRYQQGRALQLIKLAAALMVVGFFVLLLFHDSPGGSSLTGGLATSGRCAGSNSFFAVALALLLGERPAPTSPVCLLGSGKQLPSLVPAELSCALPGARFVSSLSLCSVWYADLMGLNAFETNRAVESHVLRVPSGVSLLIKSSPFEVATNRGKEMVLRNVDSAYFAAVGEVSRLDRPPRCRIKVILKPEEDDEEEENSSVGPMYVMTPKSDTIFFDAAKEYAKKRGYGFLVPSEGCEEAYKWLPSSWRKIAYLKLAANQLQNPKKEKKSGWVLWLDPLALVTNNDFELEKLIRGPFSGEGGVLLVGQDAQPPYMINVGVLMAKVSPESVAVLETVWQIGLMKGWTGPESYYWDQNALTYLTEKGMRFDEFRFWLTAIRPMPHRILSSFMRQDRSSVERDLATGHWHHGDFIALMTGVDKKDALTQAQIVRSLKADQPLRWLSGAYQYPVRKVIPPVYSVHINTYFFCEKPTWLHFTHEAPGRHTLNPSCVWWDNGGNRYDRVWCVVRTINYNLNLETGFYEWPDVGRTINQFFELSTDQYLHSPGRTLEIDSTMEMFVPVSILSKMTPMRTEGFEDVKMIRVGGTLYGIATCLQMNKQQNCQIVLLTIRDNKIEKAVPLVGYRDQDCHKNWMPFEFGGALHLIEQVDPLVVIKPDIEAGRAVPLFEDRIVFYNGLRLRGTSNGINFENGHLFLIHETITRGIEYAHRFLYLESGTLGWKRKLSRPFFLERRHVEFCIGLRMNEDKSRLILGFGFLDLKAGFLQVKIGSPKEFLEREYFWMEQGQ